LSPLDTAHPAGAPRILIDPSSHHLLNAGDVAMMQICAERLRATWPDARIEMLTTASELLAEHCPGVRPIPAIGRYALTERDSAWPPWPPALARAALARAGHRLAGREPAARTFAEALLNADLLLFSGRGGLTDAFPEETAAMLTELEIAARIDLPVALVGQGIGPLEDRRARARMASTLPGVMFVSLREGRRSPDLLASIGVAPERIAVTGDDAIELALRSRPDRLGDAVGLNVRVAGYAGFGRDAAAQIGAAVGHAARELGADVVPIAISSHPHENESAAPQGAGAKSTGIATPASAIAAAGRCRVAVVGSYHAAVFALSQGVPVVGLAASPYYVDKLLGLRERFGEGCKVVQTDGGLSGAALEAVVDELDCQWSAAPALRDGLLGAAERQVALSRAAHARVAAAIATTVVPTPPDRDAAASRR
jgi:polysaccharide pyruvyl transferase WcaK-like protein